MGRKVGVVTGSGLPVRGLASRMTLRAPAALLATLGCVSRMAARASTNRRSPGPGCVDAPGSGESGAEVLQEGLEGDLIASLGETAHGLLAGLFVRIIQGFAERGPDLGRVRGELCSQPVGRPHRPRRTSPRVSEFARDLSQPP
jgi:hypothetical protein